MILAFLGGISDARAQMLGAPRTYKSGSRARRILPAVHFEPITVSMPELRVMRSTTYELNVCMKSHHAVAYLERGHAEWWSRGRVWSSGPGAIQLKQPGDVHRDRAYHGPVVYQVVLFSDADMERIRHDGRVVAHPQLLPSDPRGEPFRRLHRAIAARADRLALEVAVAEAVQAFVEAERVLPDQTRPVRRAQAYLRAHLAEEVSLDVLAAEAGMDKFHLARAFREQVGMPPHAYLTELRVAAARRLLDRGLRAGEVAQQVGLYDQSQLNRHFRRIVGTTPGRYARNGGRRRRRSSSSGSLAGPRP